MIVVDSSIWIAQLRGLDTAGVHRLNSIDESGSIVVGDLILLEVLQGARNERHAAEVERHLRQFPIEGVLDDELAVQAARNYRRLREKGVTIRKTIDLVIGTFCIERGYALLHDDRDFEPMAANLGLRVVQTQDS
jgi:predicted nucleic acid-binding protein